MDTEIIRRAAQTVLDARTELVTNNLAIQPDAFRYLAWDFNFALVEGLLRIINRAAACNSEIAAA